MVLPRVTEATAFDRCNLRMCRLTFEEPIASPTQDALQLIALRFNPGCSSTGDTASRFFLEFRGDSTLAVCQRNGGGRTATRDEFLQLLGLLGITLPSKAQAPISAALPGQLTPSHTAQATA